MLVKRVLFARITLSLPENPVPLGRTMNVA
jgi:hypothetical protein